MGNTVPHGNFYKKVTYPRIIFSQYCRFPVDYVILGKDAELKLLKGVLEKKYKNNTFFDHAILDFLCNISGTAEKLESIHKKIDWDIAHGSIVHANKPDRDLVNSVHDGLMLYEELENKGLFSGVHPNSKAVSLFAQRYKNDILKFNLAVFLDRQDRFPIWFPTECYR